MLRKRFPQRGGGLRVDGGTAIATYLVDVLRHALRALGTVRGGGQGYLLMFMLRSVQIIMASCASVMAIARETSKLRCSGPTGVVMYLLPLLVL